MPLTKLALSLQRTMFPFRRTRFSVVGTMFSSPRTMFHRRGTRVFMPRNRVALGGTKFPLRRTMFLSRGTMFQLQRTLSSTDGTLARSPATSPPLPRTRSRRADACPRRLLIRALRQLRGYAAATPGDSYWRKQLNPGKATTGQREPTAREAGAGYT